MRSHKARKLKPKKAYGPESRWLLDELGGPGGLAKDDPILDEVIEVDEDETLSDEELMRYMLDKYEGPEGLAKEIQMRKKRKPVPEMHGPQRLPDKWVSNPTDEDLMQFMLEKYKGPQGLAQEIQRRQKRESSFYFAMAYKSKEEVFDLAKQIVKRELLKGNIAIFDENMLWQYINPLDLRDMYGLEMDEIKEELAQHSFVPANYGLEGDLEELIKSRRYRLNDFAVDFLSRYPNRAALIKVIEILDPNAMEKRPRGRRRKRDPIFILVALNEEDNPQVVETFIDKAIALAIDSVAYQPKFNDAKPVQILEDHVNVGDMRIVKKFNLNWMAVKPFLSEIQSKMEQLNKQVSISKETNEKGLPTYNILVF